MSKSKSFQDAFWGSEFCSSAGFDALKKRVRDGRASCKSYCESLRQRSKAEDDYSKSLLRSCKAMQEWSEPGATMMEAISSLRTESEKIAYAHSELCEQLQAAARRMSEFMARQKAENKMCEDAVTMALKNKIALFKQVQDAKKQYEQKSQEWVIATEIFNKAKSHQDSYATKDYDKITGNEKKAGQDASKAQKLCEDLVQKLELARVEWEQSMTEFCKLCEQQEEARIRMLQNEMWVSCNVTTMCCTDIDQHCEAVRQKLERVSVDGDIQAFIAASSTGRERPARIYFEEYHSRYAAAQTASSAQSNAFFRRPSDPYVASASPRLNCNMAVIHGAAMRPPVPQGPHGRSGAVEVLPASVLPPNAMANGQLPCAPPDRRIGQPVQVMNKHYGGHRQ